MLKKNRTKSTIGQELIVPGSCANLFNMKSIEEKLKFAARLNEILDAAGVKSAGRPAALAKIFNLSIKGTEKWLKGLSIPTHDKRIILIEIYKNTGVTYEWLMTGGCSLAELKQNRKTQDVRIIGGATGTADVKAQPYQSENNNRAAAETSTEYRSVSFGSFRLQAGITGFAVDYLDETLTPLFFHIDWLRAEGLKAENLIACIITGESMEPGLHNGDTVLIDISNNTPKDSEVFAINYEGELTIKRMYRDSGKWYLQSDNPDKTRYPNKLCSGDFCLVIGKIVRKFSSKI